VNFHPEARDEPKPKKRVTMANFKKYDSSDEEEEPKLSLEKNEVLPGK
jgi:hypothetical protein